MLTIRNKRGFASLYVNIRAKAEIFRGPEMERKFRRSHLEKNVKNPEDLKYMAIRFVSSLIEFYGKGQVEVWKT